ncbi:MAG: DUF4233 domain-containing protein [Nocardioidaceae bacterium]|nr:DUF4233 domain-containing protein [Nocardioidaceae bacterium]
MRSPRQIMCAAVLAFQSIVLGLATPVLITIEEVPKAVSLTVGLGLAVAALVIASLLRAEWAYFLGFALQLAALALGFVVPVMVVLGLLFGALWTAAYLLGKRIERQSTAVENHSHPPA